MRIHPSLAEALRGIFSIGDEELRADADLEADLQLDSLAIVELQVALEDVTGVRMGASGGADLRTLSDLQTMVERALEKGESAIPMLKLTEG